MKPTVPRIERWLSDIEAALIPPPRKRLRVIVYQAVEDKEKALAKLAECNPVLHAGHTVKDISWSDDMAAAKEKALAEHIVAHPEDAGLTIADIDWVGFEIVFEADDDNERYAEELPPTLQPGLSFMPPHASVRFSPVFTSFHQFVGCC